MKKGANKKYQIEMTSLSLFVWCCCLFFLLAWIFVLGILVGRGFFPGTVTAISDLKSQISRLQKMVNHSRSYESALQKKAESDPKLAFYEKLSNKKVEAKQKSAAKEATGQEKVPEKPWAEPETQAGMGKELTPELVKERGVEDIQKAPLKKEEAHKNQIPDNTNRGDGDFFTIQLASLAQKEKAQNMIDRLGKLGYRAYFYDVNVKGKTYYRVRCGHFNNRDEAAAFAVKLERDAGIKGFVSRLE